VTRTRGETEREKNRKKNEKKKIKSMAFRFERLLEEEARQRESEYNGSVDDDQYYNYYHVEEGEGEGEGEGVYDHDDVNLDVQQLFGWHRSPGYCGESPSNADSGDQRHVHSLPSEHYVEQCSSSNSSTGSRSSGAKTCEKNSEETRAPPLFKAHSFGHTMLLQRLSRQVSDKSIAREEALDKEKALIGDNQDNDSACLFGIELDFLGDDEQHNDGSEQCSDHGASFEDTLLVCNDFDSFVGQAFKEEHVEQKHNVEAEQVEVERKQVQVQVEQKQVEVQVKVEQADEQKQVEVEVEVEVEQKVEDVIDDDETKVLNELKERRRRAEERIEAARRRIEAARARRKAVQHVSKELEAEEEQRKSMPLVPSRAEKPSLRRRSPSATAMIDEKMQEIRRRVAERLTAKGIAPTPADATTMTAVAAKNASQEIVEAAIRVPKPARPLSDAKREKREQQRRRLEKKQSKSATMATTTTRKDSGDGDAVAPIAIGIKPSSSPPSPVGSRGRRRRSKSARRTGASDAIVTAKQTPSAATDDGVAAALPVGRRPVNIRASMNDATTRKVAKESGVMRRRTVRSPSIERLPIILGRQRTRETIVYRKAAERQRLREQAAEANDSGDNDQDGDDNEFHRHLKVAAVAAAAAAAAKEQEQQHTSERKCMPAKTKRSSKSLTDAMPKRLRPKRSGKAPHQKQAERHRRKERKKAKRRNQSSSPSPSSPSPSRQSKAVRRAVKNGSSISSPQTTSAANISDAPTSDELAHCMGIVEVAESAFTLRSDSPIRPERPSENFY
jgi:hypothetical protein